MKTSVHKALMKKVYHFGFAAKSENPGKYDDNSYLWICRKIWVEIILIMQKNCIFREYSVRRVHLHFRLNNCR